LGDFALGQAAPLAHLGEPVCPDLGDEPQRAALDVLAADRLEVLVATRSTGCRSGGGSEPSNTQGSITALPQVSYASAASLYEGPDRQDQEPSAKGQVEQTRSLRDVGMLRTSGRSGNELIAGAQHSDQGYYRGGVHRMAAYLAAA
jgi:hypothetical protein